MFPRRFLFILLTAALGFPAETRALSLREVLRHPLSFLQDLLEPAGPHERFRRGLERRGLDTTAMGRAWIGASRRALEQPLDGGMGFAERIHVDGRTPRATGYALAGRLGQVLELELDVEAAESLIVFLDLFDGGTGAGADASRSRASLVARESRMGRIQVAWEFPGDGPYLLRLQPRPGVSGLYSIRVRMRPSLPFPLPGLDGRAVASVFGDPRDGGRRRHMGVDILAPKGTPVLATVAGRAWTGENRLGGKVVWVRRGLAGPTFYHAHLDRWAISSGRQVRPGDTLGFVGNSGNARTTPPHLHFGIYGFGKGAVDPLPFLRSFPESRAPEADAARHVGREGRIRGNGARLRTEPGVRTAGTPGDVPAGTRVRVTGARGAWLQVELEDGRIGYLPAARFRTAG